MNIDSEQALQDAFDNGSISIEELIKLSNSGDFDAKYVLAICYFDADMVERNTDKTYILLKQAADAGHIRASHDLGCFKYYGYGFPKNFQNINQAIQYLEISASKGYKPSKEMLSFIKNNA